MNIDEETLKLKLKQFLQAESKSISFFFKEYGAGELSDEHITEAVEQFMEELK